MKQSIKLIIWACILVIFMLLAFFGYRYLSGRYNKADRSDKNPPASDGAAENDDSEDTSDKNDSSDASDNNNAEKAPDFTVLDNDGNRVSLSDKLGKPVMVNFWATWCGPCQSELPAFNDAYKEHSGDITFMMIDLTDGAYDKLPEVKEFVKEKGYDFPVYFDTESDGARAYNIYSIPLTVMIDKDGYIYKTHLGAMNDEQLEKYIDEILGGT